MLLKEAAKTGLVTLGMRTPMTGLRREKPDDAAAGRYPTSAAARRTFRAISSLTAPVPFKTREAVASEQPARKATCWRVVMTGVHCCKLPQKARRKATTYDKPGGRRNW